MTTAELIEKLERADGAAWVLDAAIARELGFLEELAGMVRLPAYTSSIDAAMTLVPAGMRDELEISTMHQVARVALNLNHAPNDGPYYGSHDCNSIPIALCIAALKAKEADNG